MCFGTVRPCQFTHYVETVCTWACSVCCSTVCPWQNDANSLSVVTVAQFIHDNSLCCGRVCPCQLGRDVMAQFVSTNSLCLSTVCPSQLAHSVVAEFIHASYYIQAVKSLDVHHFCATWNHQDAVEMIKNILIIAILFIYIHLTCK